MNREKIGRNNHKSPKFRESYDEEFDWVDLQENQKRPKKLNKNSQRKTIVKKKWSGIGNRRDV